MFKRIAAPIIFMIALFQLAVLEQRSKRKTIGDIKDD
jgi:hypothetical protein